MWGEWEWHHLPATCTCGARTYWYIVRPSTYWVVRFTPCGEEHPPTVYPS